MSKKIVVPADYPKSVGSPNPDTYPPDVVTKILTAVAAHQGRVSPALQSVRSEIEGKMPAQDTVDEWKRTQYGDQYRRILQELGTEQEQTIAGLARRIALSAASTELMAIEAAAKRLQAGRDEDPARSAANLSRVKSANIEKVLQLEGRPTVISERVELTATLNALQAKKVIRLASEIVDGEVEEITDGSSDD